MDQLVDSCPNNIDGVPGYLFLTLINTLLATKCVINSKDKYPVDSAPLIKDQDEFDFIVVGAGTAGSIVANKLTENSNLKVLVLEAGGLPSSTSDIPALFFSQHGTAEDWQYTTEPSKTCCRGFKDGRCRWTRGKCLGGSSSLNAMLYLRANERDYDRWVRDGNKDWNFHNILKYYDELENIHSNEELAEPKSYLPISQYTSTEPIVKTLKESAEILGCPTYDRNQNLGFFSATLTINKGLRVNTAAAFLGNVKKRPNLFVARNAHVNKIVIKHGQAESIIVNINNKNLTIKASKEIILSAGTINSPQILMLSGIGPKEHLEELGIPVIKNLSVGENLQDHLIFIGTAYTIAKNSENVLDPIEEIYKYFRNQTGAFSQIGITNFLGFINTKNDSQFPNIQFHNILFTKKDNYLLSEFFRSIGLKDQYVKIFIEKNLEQPIIIIAPTILNPKSRGKILLRSQNPLEHPLIYDNYLTENQDVETLIEGIEFIEKQLRTEAFKDSNAQLLNLSIDECNSFEYKSRDYWKCCIKHLATTIYHPVGTCKMGSKTDPQAVVDSKLRVHGIPNLRVIDASIMPTIVSVNTNGPVAALALKGGNMILENWERKLEHNEL